MGLKSCKDLLALDEMGSGIIKVTGTAGGDPDDKRKEHQEI
jgi:hypothetical protein